MINRSIFSRVAICFLIPMALAIVHSCVGIYVVLQMLNAFGEPNSFLHILTAGEIILAIYLVYFFASGMQVYRPAAANCLKGEEGQKSIKKNPLLPAGGGFFFLSFQPGTHSPFPRIISIP